MTSQKPSIGWQSWSTPFPAWHGLPRWDYSPFKLRPLTSTFRKTTKRPVQLRYWCSWYAYGWDVTHEKIMATLELIKKHQLSFTHILIDDGWTTWGDWQKPDQSRFHNLSTTIKKIKSSKLKAGLWMAPFLASSKSKLYNSHPGWFVKYKNKPVRGLQTVPIWDFLLPQQYLLNLELPEVKKYLMECIDLAVKKWRVDLLKLDFLYAPYFNPHLSSDDLPHRQVEWLLSGIKDKYPALTVVACGAPFSPTLGTVDAIRISKDTALPPEIPTLLNRLLYPMRVKMLAHKLMATDLPQNTVLDPDVRMIGLDNTQTDSIWDTISTPILGIGDNLSQLSLAQINKIKVWLSNHQR